MKTIGIVGFGSFGELLAKLLAPCIEVIVHSRRGINSSMLPENTRVGSLEEVARCSVVIIATELEGLEAVCKQLAQYVTPQTIVMDVCSVKVKPTEIMQQELGNKCRLLATHPLFGPNSVAENGGSAKGMKMVWHEVAGEGFDELAALFAQKLGVEIVQMTPEEHDREMAWIHGLTFFVGRGLVNLGLPALTLDTGYYRRLLDLYELEKTHSQELFETIELGNPFAKEVRQGYLETLQNLERNLEGKK